MKFIIAEFIHNEQEDHHAYSNANGQTENIDERKNFVFHQVSPGDLEIVFYHGYMVKSFKKFHRISYNTTVGEKIFRRVEVLQ
jgi:hypothetical protein